MSIDNERWGDHVHIAGCNVGQAHAGPCRQSPPDHTVDGLRRILTDRERELLALKGPCSSGGCRLHFAHTGPCDTSPGRTLVASNPGHGGTTSWVRARYEASTTAPDSSTPDRPLTWQDAINALHESAAATTKLAEDYRLRANNVFQPPEQTNNLADHAGYYDRVANITTACAHWLTSKTPPDGTPRLVVEDYTDATDPGRSGSNARVRARGGDSGE